MSKLSIQHCTDFTRKCQYVKTAFVMPKKTKKQKLLADLHKKIYLTTTHQISDTQDMPDLVKGQNSPLHLSQTPIYTTSLEFINKNVVKAKTLKSDTSYNFVRNDLIKITIFTILALSLQGVLYFVIRTR